MLEDLKEQERQYKEAIANILEGGQEIQTRTGRIKLGNLSVLRQQLTEIQNQIAELQGNGYTDTECFVFRGCR